MTIVTLTFISSESETVSGIPDTVSISVNVTSTIYYTLDGTLPDVRSLTYVSPIHLPTNKNSVTLSAVAYYLDGYGSLVPSAVVSHLYFTDVSSLDDRDRYLNFEGIVYSYPGGLNIPYYYDASGEIKFTIDVPIYDLDLELSDRDLVGNFIGTDNQVEPIPPDETPTLIDNDWTLFSSPNLSQFNLSKFDPNAKYIVIDGRDNSSEQVVKLINGPYMSLRSLGTSFGGIEYLNHLGENYVSGDGCRALYDRQKGIIVFNYFDSNTSRWVKSIQKLDPIQKSNTNHIIRNPLVFQWFLFGRQQGVG